MSSTQRAMRIGGLVLLGLFVALTGLSARQNQGAAVRLAYQFPEGRTLSYRVAIREKANMQVSGQDVNAETQSTLEFTLKPESVTDATFGITVTVDRMKQAVGSQGGQPKILQDLAGQSYDVSMTRLGKVTGPSGQPGDVGAFLPELPDRAVKIGDTWPSQVSGGRKFSGREIFVEKKNANTIDGFETVDGVECVRVKTKTTETWKMSHGEGTASPVLDRNTTSTATWYFAIKQGFLVKSDSKSSFVGSMPAAQTNVRTPVSGEATAEVRVVRK